MKCIDIAFNWHSGISSPLYSFASTRKIHSEHHRDDVLDEIDECIRWTELHRNQQLRDIDDLKSVSRVVIDIPIGVELPDPHRR